MKEGQEDDLKAMDTIARMATYDEKKEHALEKARKIEADQGIIVPEP